jgi:hypothetical protein
MAAPLVFAPKKSGLGLYSPGIEVRMAAIKDQQKIAKLQAMFSKLKTLFSRLQE